VSDEESSPPTPDQLDFAGAGAGARMAGQAAHRHHQPDSRIWPATGAGLRSRTILITDWFAGTRHQSSSLPNVRAGADEAGPPDAHDDEYKRNATASLQRSGRTVASCTVIFTAGRDLRRTRIGRARAPTCRRCRGCKAAARCPRIGRHPARTHGRLASVFWSSLPQDSLMARLHDRRLLRKRKAPARSGRTISAAAVGSNSS
jgi:hypothetical protein